VTTLPSSPPGQRLKTLSEPEQKIYDLVTKRFLAIFYPSAEYNITTRITRIEKEAFKTEGKVLVTPGWLAVYGKEAQGDEESPNLPPLEKNERIWAKDVEVKGKATQPPPRFSEATLLTAMEGAGKLIEDEELREAMSERGLGTPATRAATIEGLLAEEYLHRNGRELQPTAKAFSLLFALEQLQVDEIRSPELTGEWEYKLKEMEHGRLSRDEFMQHIMDRTRAMVERIKTGEFADPDFGTLKTPCPRCGAKIHEGYKHFTCENCDYKLWKVVASRQWETAEMDELLAKRTIGPLQGFRSKMGRAFAAIIKLKDDHTPEFDFGQSDADADGEEVDFSTQEALGACPKCGSRVFEHGMAYVCEKSVGAGRTCDFRSGKVILQQEVGRADMQKLLATGRTDLLKGFVSNKTRRKFSAYLVRDPKTGKVGFEFEPRAPKAGAVAKPAAAKAEAANEPAVKKAAAKKPVAKKTATKKVPAGDTATKAQPEESGRQKARREEGHGEESLMAERGRHPRDPRFLVPAGRRLSSRMVPQGRGLRCRDPRRFGAEVEAALAGRACRCRDDAGLLARILLLDQFTRNIFRGTPRAFAGDAQALAIATNSGRQRPRQEPDPWQRWFAYLPFEHAESLLEQERSVALYAALRREAQGGAFDSATTTP
jgi:DNA topoisomerase-3